MSIYRQSIFDINISNRAKDLECFETLKWDSAAAGDKLQESRSHLLAVGSNNVPEPDNLMGKADVTKFAEF